MKLKSLFEHVIIQIELKHVFTVLIDKTILHVITALF